MASDLKAPNMEGSRIREAIKITWIGFIVNFILSAGKILAGIFGRSSAMLADGIHSLSDFITDFIIIIFIKVSSREKDQDHHYGHGKFETLATLLVSVILFLAGIGLLYNGGEKIYYSLKGIEIEKPTWLALAAAIISILIKEWLYRITVYTGKKIKSEAIIANGWHHRSDAFSSMGTLVGISGAMFLGTQWRILDPIASIIVSMFIIIVAFKVMKPALDELMEKALPPEIEEQINGIILSIAGVKNCHNLKTRKSGNNYIIDVHVKVAPQITVVEAHDIASNVEHALSDTFGNGTQSTIHIEPYFAK